VTEFENSNYRISVKCLALAIVTSVVGSCLIAAESGGTPVQLKQTIALTGVEGRIDHFALDAAGDRLFVCAVGNNTVEVLDLRKGERIHSITGLGSPQGIAYIPELDRLFVANDKGGICKIYDAKSFQTVGELNFKDDADNVRYDSATKEIYVGFGSGGIAVVNAPDGKQISSIKLSAHPEAFELEKSSNRIFVNVPNSRHVAVIDRDKGEVAATWKTDLAFGNFPMGLDEANHRLFIGCRIPSKLVVLNTDSGTLLPRSASPAIPMRSSTIRSATAFTPFAVPERSTSLSKLTSTLTRLSPRLTRRMGRAPGFLCQTEIFYLLRSHTVVRNGPRSAPTRSNS
jgi:hypothetical protein